MTKGQTSFSKGCSVEVFGFFLAIELLGLLQGDLLQHRAAFFSARARLARRTATLT
jgi:hypothetical protein